MQYEGKNIYMKKINLGVVSIFFITFVLSTTSSNKFLYFFYNNRIGISLRRHIMIKPTLSKLAGWLADTHISSFLIKPFIKKYNIDMNEAIHTNPKEYTSLNDFFTRTQCTD